MTPPRVRSGFDRVGGNRLTGLGALLLAMVIVGLASPPRAADASVLAVLWAAAAAVLVIGVVWPLVAVRRITLDVRSRRDAVVGEQVDLEVRTLGRGWSCEIRGLDPTGPWVRAEVPGEGRLAHLADRRGHFPVMRVEVRVTAPLGVLSAHRVHEVVLPVPVDVAPRPLDVRWVPDRVPRAGGSVSASATLGGDLVRSVRPYVPGDPAHLVHWPSSARIGALVVREMEPPQPWGQVVVVDLRDLGADTERAAAYAMGACRAVLLAGGELVVATCEDSGPTVGPVATLRDAGRRLARAVPGPPGTPPDGWPVVEIGS